MYQDVEAALAGAIEGAHEALALLKDDLALVQSEQPHDENAGTAAQKAATASSTHRWRIGPGCR